MARIGQIVINVYSRYSVLEVLATLEPSIIKCYHFDRMRPSCYVFVFKNTFPLIFGGLSNQFLHRMLGICHLQITDNLTGQFRQSSQKFCMIQLSIISILCNKHLLHIFHVLPPHHHPAPAPPPPLSLSHHQYSDEKLIIRLTGSFGKQLQDY